MPFQGEFTHILVPRAMPWAKCLLAFQAVSTWGSHYSRNSRTLYNSRRQYIDLVRKQKSLPEVCSGLGEGMEGMSLMLIPSAS